ncbi:hypothetical protein HY772_03860 [Candidatus Woesearchaeota archaeon]|nr:hypothetical protein [Candidatus Woesearchaeota archaeon]
MMDIINRTQNRLWQRVIFATVFRWGFYATAAAALAVLAGKVMGNIWTGWYTLPAAGLVIGLITGLFKRPSPEHTAIYIDRVTDKENYFATLLYCLTKEQPNPVEKAFPDAPAGSGPVMPLQIPYNLHYPLMFAVSLIIIFIITLAPVMSTATTDSPVANNSGLVVPAPGRAAAGTANLPDLAVQAGMAKLRKEIAQLLKDIEQGKLNPAAILEKVNGFVTASGSVEELAEIKALLEKLQPQIPQIYEPRITQIRGEVAQRLSRINSSGGFSLAGEPGDGIGGTTGQETPSGNVAGINTEPGHIPTPKTIEEIMRKPYWPAEYDEVVKKYFGDK